MKRSHSSCNLVDKKENFKQCSLGHYLASKSTYYFAWHLTFAHFAESFRFDRVTCLIITAKKIQLKTRWMKCVRIAAFWEFKENVDYLTSVIIVTIASFTLRTVSSSSIGTCFTNDIPWSLSWQSILKYSRKHMMVKY